jgi:hypothetical protein
MAELTPKQKSAVARAKQNPDLLWVLLSKAKGLQWVPEFRDAGWLSPELFPGPTPPDERGFYSFPHWPIASFLAENAGDLGQIEHEESAKVIWAFLLESTRFAQAALKHNFRVWWNFSRIVRKIPVHLLDVEDLWVIDYWMDDPFDSGLLAEELGKWAVDLLEGGDVNDRCREIALASLKSIFRVRKALDGRLHLPVSDWYAERIGRAVVEVAVLQVGSRFLGVLEASLQEVMGGASKDKTSFVWRPAVEDHPQNRSVESAPSILISLIRDALQVLVRSAPNDALAHVSLLIESQSQVLRRIGINAVRQDFQALKSLVPKLLVVEAFIPEYRHEIWWLLHDCFAEFSEDDRSRVLALIDEAESPEEGEEHDLRAFEYRRAVWLSAVQAHPRGRDAYRDSVERCGVEPEHPDFSVFSSGGWVSHESPFDIDDLRSLTAQGLVDRLHAYEPPAVPVFRGPDLEGLTKALREVIKSSPVFYASQLDVLAALRLPFAYEVLEAYADLLRDEAPLPWEALWPKILRFAFVVVRTSDFWAEENKQSRFGFVGTRYWIVGSIGRLIVAGTHDGDRALPRSLSSYALELIDFVLAREVGEPFSVDKDAVSIAINSPRGRCVEALICLSLRDCRMASGENNGHADVWGRYESRFDLELSRKGEYEFTTLVVNYLPNFLFMSKDWLLANLPLIFDATDGVRWSSSMQAYPYVSGVYSPVYEFLRDCGHFEAALETGWPGDRVIERVVGDACVAFLRGSERLGDENGLMQLLVRRRNPDEMSRVVRFFWHLRESPDLGRLQRDRVIEFWKAIDSSVTGDASADPLLGRLLALIGYLPSLSGGFFGLAFRAASAFKSSREVDAYDVLKSLASLSADFPVEVSRIWLEVLKTSDMSYPEDAIAEALRAIAASGGEGRQLAKAVVDSYVKKKNLVPYEIWKRIGQDSL